MVRDEAGADGVGQGKGQRAEAVIEDQSQVQVPIKRGGTPVESTQAHQVPGHVPVLGIVETEARLVPLRLEGERRRVGRRGALPVPLTAGCTLVLDQHAQGFEVVGRGADHELDELTVTLKIGLDQADLIVQLQAQLVDEEEQQTQENGAIGQGDDPVVIAEKVDGGSG